MRVAAKSQPWLPLTYLALASLLELRSKAPQSYGTMSTVRAGCRRGCWRRRTSDAGAGLPSGKWKILSDFCPVSMMGSLKRLLLDVAPVALMTEGSVPSRMPLLMR